MLTWRPRLGQPSNLQQLVAFVPLALYSTRSQPWIGICRGVERSDSTLGSITISDAEFPFGTLESFREQLHVVASFCPIYPPVNNNSTRLSRSDPPVAWLHLNSELWGVVCGISGLLISQCYRFAPEIMSAQSMRNLTVQGRSGNPRYAIQNSLDGLPELGDSSQIRGNAPASAKRLVKNVFDAYGVGTEGSFASSVGGLVRLVEANAKGYQRSPEQPGPKEKVEASTVAEITISPGTYWRISVSRPHLTRPRGNGRDA